MLSDPLFTGSIAAVAVASFGAGYLFGRSGSTPISSSNRARRHREQSSSRSDLTHGQEDNDSDYTSNDDDDSDGDDDDDNGDIVSIGNPNAESDLIKQYGSSNLKMALVVRTDIGMTKGKVAAQCSHATLGAYKMALKETPTLLAKWERQGQAKVALKGEGGEDGILTLQAQAVSMGLAARSIVDAGRTQLAPNTRTVLAIGPGPAAAIDTITGHLKLF